MMSAPISAIRRVTVGPARYCEKSSTLMPASMPRGFPAEWFSAPFFIAYLLDDYCPQPRSLRGPADLVSKPHLADSLARLAGSPSAGQEERLKRWQGACAPCHAE